jgi:cell division protease FtsH
LAFGEKEGEVFLGRDLGHARNYSEATAVEIDNEIRRIVQESYDKARRILESHRDGLVSVAEALLERETIEGEEVRRIILGNTPAGAGDASAGAADDTAGTGV